ncbi:hypothetical protein LINPERPRIM_LOCUS20511, partial [Linum perenne]
VLVKGVSFIVLVGVSCALLSSCVVVVLLSEFCLIVFWLCSCCE